MKRRLKLSSLLLAGVLLCTSLTACGKKDKETTTATNLNANIAPQTVTPAEPDEAFYAGQTAFALKLMQETLKSQQSNVLISPYSVMQALAMTANGAKGETLKQMEQILGGQSIADLNRALYTVRSKQPNDEKCKLKSANSLWLRDQGNTLNVKQDFLQTNADYYGAAAYKEPFDNSTADKINRWCSENTDGMIPKIIDEINPETAMYLINAVLFDAKWASKYQDEPTESEFTALNGQKQTVQMMRSTEFTYLHDAHATGFIKPYAGEKYAFAALLPEEGMSVTDYVAGLTPESLRETLKGASSRSVRAGLPKFSYDFSTEMSHSLKAMGMQQAFEANADLSGMADGNLFIGNVLHKTHIDVDLDGTKAAAVTAVEVDSCAPAEDAVSVFLDRPFLYMILDTESNLPVFMGILTEVS